jgi:hypothetical protein
MTKTYYNRDEIREIGSKVPEDMFFSWWTQGVENFKMLAIKRIDDDIYYFDENGVCQIITVDEVRKQVEEGSCKIMGMWMSLDEKALGIYMRSCNDIRSSTVWRNAVKSINVGDTTARFVFTLNYPDVLRKEPWCFPDIEDPEFLVKSISKPKICEVSEDENTFDHIVVTVHFTDYDFFYERDQFIERYQEEICDLALKKIELDPYFAWFRIPIYNLRLSKAVFVSKRSYLTLWYERTNR